MLDGTDEPIYNGSWTTVIPVGLAFQAGERLASVSVPDGRDVGGW